LSPCFRCTNFGAGSQFTWQALATYNWQMCSFGPMRVDGYAGWRALRVDYETGSGVGRYDFNVLQAGPRRRLHGAVLANSSVNVGQPSLRGAQREWSAGNSLRR